MGVHFAAASLSYLERAAGHVTVCASASGTGRAGSGSKEPAVVAAD